MLSFNTFKTIILVVASTVLFSACAQLGNTLAEVTKPKKKKQYGEVKTEQVVDLSDYLRPEDVVLDKKKLIGQTKEVAGYLHCSQSAACFLSQDLHKSIGMTTAQGSQIIANIEDMGREARKFAISCVYTKPCLVTLTGKIGEGFVDPEIKATKLVQL